jgi:superfamily II DNA/RNA helicase
MLNDVCPVSALKQESIAYGANNASPQTAAVEAATSFPFAPATERVKKSKQDLTTADDQRVNPHSNRVVMTELTEDDVRGAQAELHQKSMEHVHSAVGSTSESSSAPAEFITDYAAHAAANPDATQVDGVMFHVPATIVFCNTVPACRAVEIALCEAGFAAVGYHGAVPSHSRAQNWRRFCAGVCV